ncbi:MAG TPA: hypothetical protein VFH95_13210 [Candidatus Kapabacteria bacterium]|nr:hypothetical protein [Candidatus Kapabacteria bacterium]
MKNVVFLCVPVEILSLYETLKRQNDLLSPVVKETITEIDIASRRLLKNCQNAILNSNIPGKHYKVFVKDTRLSRPINVELFDIDLPSAHTALYRRGDLSSLNKKEVARLLYTLYMSFCAAIDVSQSDNKKTPATFFEKFIGNIFAIELGVQPVTALPMLNEESLATDYIYQSAEGKAHIHLQVKLSTRERAIEAWAHQRIIDGIFGVDSYRGILVVGAETNLKKANMSVTDVCVPNQWGVYQKYIAKLHRIYYLDIPARTENLHAVPPYIQVKHLSEFFFEKDTVLQPPRG